jgi:hypothetical protein
MRQPVLVIIAITVTVAAAVADAALIFFRQPAVFVMMVKELCIFTDAVTLPPCGQRRILFRSATRLPAGSVMYLRN